MREGEREGGGGGGRWGGAKVGVGGQTVLMRDTVEHLSSKDCFMMLFPPFHSGFCLDSSC